MTESILRVQDVTKRYPGVIALNHVSMEFREGEVHGLVGENGAGKSTIIKVISGAISPDGGAVYYNGRDLTQLKNREIRETGIEVVYQELNLASQLPVYENIYVGNLLRKRNGLVDRGTMIAETRKLFDQLGIDIDPEIRVDKLTVAFQQFVEIARAISRHAKILIMDEPTATLTNTDVQILFRTIRKLRADGVTILYVSHRMEEIFEITDRCTVMRDGECITTVQTSETSRKELIQYMVGREVTESYPKRSAVIGEEVLRAEHLTGNGVSDINFSLHRGEILGFGGLVGAGRTETAEMIFGAARTESGRLLIHGEEVRIDSPQKAVEHGIALIPEDRKQHGLILSKSILENATLPTMHAFAKHHVLNRKRQIQATQEQVDALQIKTPSIDQLAKNLSGGNQQKVVLAKWLIGQSEILIFDEPTRGIDVGAKHEIYCLMNKLVESGKSIIMISSDMPELLGMSDRLVVLCERHQAGTLDREHMDQHTVLDLASGDK